MTVAPAHAGMDPRASPMLYGASLSPPPTRGWTRPAYRDDRRRPVAPAHAGMDPLGCRGAHRHSRRPRPRGDGPVQGAARARRDRSPPPTRGWTVLAHGGRGLARVAPAHAGMDRCRPPSWTPRACRPRPRGDGPAAALGITYFSVSPPPTRGWTRPPLPQYRVPLVAPAHAGMDPWPWWRSEARCGRPRPRGDGPGRDLSSTRPRVSPPPTRGWTRPVRLRRTVGHVAPAHAGMDPRG